MPLSQVGIWEMPLAPVANAFAGTVTTTYYNISNYKQTTFLYIKAVGTTGTATITVLGATSSAGAGATAVPFRYRVCTTLDTWGAFTTATSAGFTTTAGSNQLYEIVVDNDVFGGNSTSGTAMNWVALQSVEVVASAVLGGVIAHLGLPRYPEATQSTALT
jgi:hypothetical protein